MRHHLHIALALMLVWALLVATSTARAEHAGSHPIDALCDQEWRDSSGDWHAIEQSTIALTQGTRIRLRLRYTHNNDGSVYYPVTFTTSSGSGIFMGPVHAIDSDVRWGGGGYSSSNIKYVELATDDWPDGTDRLHFFVRSDATTGALASCDFTLDLRAKPTLDADGDGLLDSWETSGLDVDHDGTVDLPLHQPPYNANPQKRDVFVEVDYMRCGEPGSTCTPGDNHDDQPSTAALDDVVAAFANAPAVEPGETGPLATLPGITLHYIRDEAVPHTDFLPFSDLPDFFDPDFGDLKHGRGTHKFCGTQAEHGFFGTAADRSSPRCSHILLAKLLVYHYAVFGHSYSANLSSGVSDGANDLMVTLGGWSPNAIALAGGQRAAEAGTFMHELGHDLGLGHGGPTDYCYEKNYCDYVNAASNCKPNYLSVMNYTRQFPNIDPARPLDYSRSELPTLNEDGKLNEPDGIGVATPTVIFGVGGALSRDGDGGQSVDWETGNGPASSTNVRADVNFIKAIDGCSLATPDQFQLGGYNDWQHLRLNFRGRAGMGEEHRGVGMSAPLQPAPEQTATDVVSAFNAGDFDADGIVNETDNCLNTTNPGQADTDGDARGDACDAHTIVAIDFGSLGTSTNRIRLSSRGRVAVAVLARGSFEPTELVSPETLRFGRSGNEASLEACRSDATDVDRDGREDLVCDFVIADTGLTERDTTARLTAALDDRTRIEGSDSVVVER